MLLPLLLVLCFQGLLAQQTCQTCVAQGHSWCVESSKCQALTCKTSIKNPLNCPTAPQTGFEYTDDFGRKVAMPIITAAGISNPMTCLKNVFPAMVLDQSIYCPCSEIIRNTTQGCHVYTTYDPSQKLIVVSFRGTDGALQLDEEMESFFEKKEPFFNNGHVFKYFYDAFMMIWNQGLETSVRSLKFKYPDYGIYVMGHSLGGALASVCASYLVKVNLADPTNLKLVTFGQPRTGDKDWAQWHDSTFLYSYRIVNHHDIVSHIPPRGGADEVWHHRYEIWYNNKMAVGDSWEMCPEDDGHYCSNTVPDTSFNTGDHMTYFDRDMYGWASGGCNFSEPYKN